MSSAKTKKTAPGTGSCRGWWWEHDWAAVRVGSIVVGDQLANHSTTRTVRFALMPALRSLAAAAQRAADAFGLLPAAYSTTDAPRPPRSEPA